MSTPAVPKSITPLQLTTIAMTKAIPKTIMSLIRNWLRKIVLFRLKLTWMKSLRKDSFYQKLASLKASFKSLKSNCKKKKKKEKSIPGWETSTKLRLKDKAKTKHQNWQNNQIKKISPKDKSSNQSHPSKAWNLY